MRELKKGDKVFVREVVANWFEDGSDMQLFIPGVFEGYSKNQGAVGIVRTMYFGEERRVRVNVKHLTYCGEPDKPVAARGTDLVEDINLDEIYSKAKESCHYTLLNLGKE